MMERHFHVRNLADSTARLEIGSADYEGNGRGEARRPWVRILEGFSANSERLVKQMSPPIKQSGGTDS